MPSIVETSSGRGKAIPIEMCGMGFCGSGCLPALCGKSKTPASIHPPSMVVARNMRGSRLDCTGRRVPGDCGVAEIRLVGHVASERSVVTEDSVFYDRCA